MLYNSTFKRTIFENGWQAIAIAIKIKTIIMVRNKILLSILNYYTLIYLV